MIHAPTSPSERLDWLRLARTPRVGPVTFFQLLTRFGSPGRALQELPNLTRGGGRAGKLAPPAIESVQLENAATEQYGARILCAADPDYPALLKTLKAPPPVLTALGRTDLTSKPAIAIVGARNASAAGRKLTRDMAAELSRAGYVIVSGLARGVDGEAHGASLEGGTVAVLGGGIDHIYPPQHDRLYAAIAANGLLISESPFGHRATARDFPRRNRLITGCAAGVVVVEATERSGSLISARTAGEQGREVMSVPGSPLDPRSAGTNRLLREGATLVRHAEDVLDAMSGLQRNMFAAPPPPDFEADGIEDDIPPSQIAAVRAALTPNAMPIDEIARAAGIGAGRCAAILMELELAGEATTLPGALASRSVE
ncbi:MAG: DNA-processing protein DprA [Pseudomonadota bacterium]